LISPGQANLSVNQAPEEIQKYSPQMLDAIDMENSRFVTVSIAQLIKEYGNEIPQLDTVLSVFKNDFISDFNVFTADYKKYIFVVSFSVLINKTPGIKRIKLILDLLKENLGYPVDIEFAYDGQFFYLLQCRPQIDSYYSDSVAIPNEISPKDTIFTADKYISNGKVLGIKTIIYVDPEEYEKLETYDDLINVASAVSELNRMLPRKSFILIGPGRWGSRGDIKLGVRVTYSDICNTAMIIEIANKNSKYQPELSFGTHFFQDLVEAGIKYLPLYPEREGTVFNSRFFSRSQNKLSQSLPAYSYLDKVIKVISIEEEYQNPYIENEVYDKTKQEGQGWKWRHYMAEVIASKMDFDAFCVKGVYLFGSTNTCTAELNSDIDIIIHFGGTKEQKKQLDAWLDGWSKALSEMNYLKTGYSSDGLLDVHYVTDEDIKNKSSYAVKINSAYDPATLLRKK
jgi:predicted nucleotidyltransferase